MGNLVILSRKFNLGAQSHRAKHLTGLFRGQLRLVRFVIWLFDEHQTRNADEHSSSDPVAR
jgi:hypothetical protein